MWEKASGTCTWPDSVSWLVVWGPWVATEKDGLAPMEEEMPGRITRQWVRREGPSLVIGTIPLYLRAKAVLVLAAEIEVRVGPSGGSGRGPRGEPARARPSVPWNILELKIGDRCARGDGWSGTKRPPSKGHQMAAAGSQRWHPRGPLPSSARRGGTLGEPSWQLMVRSVMTGNQKKAHAEEA
jgi:hypothetical protein